MSALPELVSAFPTAMPLVSLRTERPSDVAAREALLDAAMGPGRTRKSSEAIRRNRLPAEGLSLVAETDRGHLAGTVRLWNVTAGLCAGNPVPALLLGPLAVAPALAGQGIGSMLMRRAVAESLWRGARAIVLVGDEPYYARFGFSAAAAAGLAMPGPFERHRLLGLELSRGALCGAHGPIMPTGRCTAADTGLEVAATTG